MEPPLVAAARPSPRARPAGPLLDLRLGTSGAHRPTRPLAGWLCTSDELLPDGRRVPVLDRDGSHFEAAGDPERMDVAAYVGWGLWNDTHTDRYVGVPTYLEFCGPDHELAQRHGKVGWWTAGHLYDPADPASWLEYPRPRPPTNKGAVPRPPGPDLVPTPAELAAADRFWKIAAMFADGGRPLGFSAHGQRLNDPGGSPRIIWASLTQAAVCELPRNPHASAEPLALAAAAGLPDLALTLDTPLRPELLRQHPALLREVAAVVGRARGLTTEDAELLVRLGLESTP